MKSIVVQNLLLNSKVFILMKIIYLYNKNAYAHLKLRTYEDMTYIKNNYNEEGNFYYLGTDVELNEVYLLYSKKNNYILKNLLQGFSSLYDEEILIMDLDNKHGKER